VDFTAAAKHYSSLLAADATAADFSDGEMRSACRADAFSR
jgi:hypothetical protein